MANEEAREAAFETWASDVIYNNQPLTERKGIPYFLAGRAYAAGVAEGIRQAPFTREVLIAFYRLAYDEGSEGTLRFLASRFQELFDEEIDDALGEDDRG